MSHPGCRPTDQGQHVKWAQSGDKLLEPVTGSLQVDWCDVCRDGLLEEKRVERIQEACFDQQIVCSVAKLIAKAESHYDHKEMADHWRVSVNKKMFKMAQKPCSRWWTEYLLCAVSLLGYIFTYIFVQLCLP